MILIDIPMPEGCMECPCSHLITCGEHDGEMMCDALEAKGDGIVIVDGCEDKRQDNCPIIMTILK